MPLYSSLLLGFAALSVTNLRGLLHFIGLVLVVGVISGLGYSIYNIWFHPLKHIPGPSWAAATRVPYFSMILKGTLNGTIHRLHKKYGEVVRIAPNELSFISGETAWQNIYGFRTGKDQVKTYAKDRKWYPPPIEGVPSILVTNEADHSRERRLLSHAFSDKALREQEPILQSYVDLLTSRLQDEVATSSGVVDVVKWYNFTTFDVMAELTFGKSFQCLSERDYHPHVKMTFDSLKASAIIMVIRHIPSLAALFQKFGLRIIPEHLIQNRIKFFQFAQSAVQNRLNGEGHKSDFMSYIMKHNNESRGMTREEIDANVFTFLVAGSETTATMLSGTTYCLLKAPQYLCKLKKEIRGRFSKTEDITIEEANKISYLLAVINEGLRIYPPVPTGFPRIVPKGGDFISGHYVSEGTTVYVSQHAAYHSERNFVNADEFRPERWLGDPKYEADKKQNFQPFSFGPRNCLGKNLAYAEMRLILAKMIFHFDMELVSNTDTPSDWFDQKVFTLWEKPPLRVQLKPAATV